ncbi:helix-turn-helix transcriptional regulator [uncultured Cloacibacillus sp.]|uniref:helix-turn-helix transcriptional regulator n=1 Tax=uncultured Cloacibacillus sp. TaxID=889794 RepID=UPI0034C669D8
MNRGEQIRRLRRTKDLTQVELAMLVGVSVTAVCEWERGAYSPCPRNAERLSYVLESDDLLTSLLEGHKKTRRLRTGRRGLTPLCLDLPTRGIMSGTCRSI